MSPCSPGQLGGVFLIHNRMNYKNQFHKSSNSHSSHCLGIATRIPMSEVLPKDVVARLGDRSYDKRKAAALEIENMVKKLQDA